MRLSAWTTQLRRNIAAVASLSSIWLAREWNQARVAMYLATSSFQMKGANHEMVAINLNSREHVLYLLSWKIFALFLDHVISQCCQIITFTTDQFLRWCFDVTKKSSTRHRAVAEPTTSLATTNSMICKHSKTTINKYKPGLLVRLPARSHLKTSVR